MSSVSSASIPNFSFDPRAPEIIEDPYPHYQRLRANAPVFALDAHTWFLTRYRDVSWVLRDRRFGRDFTKGRAPETLGEPIHVAMSKMLIYLEPPDHTRVRSLITKAGLFREVAP